MEEMKADTKKEKEDEIKALTIQSDPAFCVKLLVAKVLDPDE